MPTEAVIYLKRYDLKNAAAQAYDAVGHIVLLDYSIRSGSFYV